MDSGMIKLTATRNLECGSNYVVQLNQPLNLCAAWNPTNPELSFHHENYMMFSGYLSEDGTCQNAASCQVKLTDLGTFDVNYK